MVLLEIAAGWKSSNGDNYDLEISSGTLTYHKGPVHTFMFYESKNGKRVDLSKEPLPYGVMFLTDEGKKQGMSGIVLPILRNHYSDILNAQPCDDFKEKDRKAMLSALEKALESR